MLRLALVLLAATAAFPAGADGRYDWDALGAEFCRLTMTGDLEAMRTILTPSLMAEVDAASNNPALYPPRILFQSYANPVPVCRARTRNAALVEIDRIEPGGTSWTEYLVVTPEPDGTTRIDDVLFATGRSDTLRTRLDQFIASR